jgi:hypothetical protein
MRDTLGIVFWRLALVVVPSVVVLGVLNALPQFLGGEPPGVVRYGSLEQLRDRLHLVAWRPARLPQPWSWPPSRVRFAVGRPDWLQFVFDSGADPVGDLVICQTTEDPPAWAAALLPRWLLRLERLPATDQEVPGSLLSPGRVLEENEISIGDRSGRLRRLFLDDGTIVNEVWWQQAARRVMLRLDAPADRAARVADAILRARP